MKLRADIKSVELSHRIPILQSVKDELLSNASIPPNKITIDDYNEYIALPLCSFMDNLSSVVGDQVQDIANYCPLRDFDECEDCCVELRDMDDAAWNEDLKAFRKAYAKYIKRIERLHVNNDILRFDKIITCSDMPILHDIITVQIGGENED